MKAKVPVNLTGFSSPLLACSKAWWSGPCGSIQLCRLMPPGAKPLWFRIVDAVYQPHELRHDVQVIPRRSEGVVRYHPALRKDNEIDVRGARCLRRRGQHGKDRGIGVIEGDRADGGEGAQVVLVGCVIAVPADYIDRRMRQFGLVE